MSVTYCTDCPIAGDATAFLDAIDISQCKYANKHDRARVLNFEAVAIHPGPECPFLLIDQLRAEVERKDEVLTKILGWREYYDRTAADALRFIEDTARAALTEKED